MAVLRNLLRPFQAVSMSAGSCIVYLLNRTSDFASSVGGGDKGSINSGIVSCAVPLTAAGAGVGLAALSSTGSGLALFPRSALDLRVNLGDPDASDAREGIPVVVAEEPGRSIEDDAVSRSFDFFLPKPPKAEPKFEFDDLSGDGCRP